MCLSQSSRRHLSITKSCTRSSSSVVLGPEEARLWLTKMRAARWSPLQRIRNSSSIGPQLQRGNSAACLQVLCNLATKLSWSKRLKCSEWSYSSSTRSLTFKSLMKWAKKGAIPSDISWLGSVHKGLREIRSVIKLTKLMISMRQQRSSKTL